MYKVNWNEVEEAGNYPRPTPGGYIARITLVQDDEAKEYIRVNWDFIDGDLKGNNRDTAQKFGFWPLSFIRSYKKSALGFFKAFKNHLEASNPGYRFEESNLAAMHGKYIGVILGEEEYFSQKDRKVKDRLVVVTTKTVQDIRDGNFTIPAKKTLTLKNASAPVYDAPASNIAETYSDGPMPWDEDGGVPLPF